MPEKVSFKVLLLAPATGADTACPIDSRDGSADVDSVHVLVNTREADNLPDEGESSMRV
jgi:hypothetical protein